MPTGGGKSPVINPVLIQEGTAIVSPLIALMKTKLMPSGVSERGIAHVLNSSLTKTEIAQVKRHLFRINKLLYVALNL
jgi:ATP-dependent DNA helicase RecQ